MNWSTRRYSLGLTAIALSACGQSLGNEFIAPPPPFGGDPTTVLQDPVSVLRVKDGDTIDVDFHGTTERVRFKGVDTPELSQPAEPYAEEARSYVLSHVGNQVDLIFDSLCVQPPDCRDTYDRLLAYIRLADGGDIGAQLISAGLARVYVYQNENFDRKAEYLALQSEAQDAELGIWCP